MQHARRRRACLSTHSKTTTTTTTTPLPPPPSPPPLPLPPSPTHTTPPPPPGRRGRRRRRKRWRKQEEMKQPVDRRIAETRAEFMASRSSQLGRRKGKKRRKKRLPCNASLPRSVSRCCLRNLDSFGRRLQVQFPSSSGSTVDTCSYPPAPVR